MFWHSSPRSRPACLRLRVVADPDTIDRRFMADQAKLDHIEDVVRSWWPESIAEDETGNMTLWRELRAARRVLLDALGFDQVA